MPQASPGPSPRVLIVSAIDSPAVGDDAQILSERFRVRRSTGSGPGALLRAALAPLSADVVYCWFLSMYGAVAVLAASVAGRPSAVVIGGVDAARDQASGYGLWLSPWRSFLARRALRSARVVLAVSDSLRREIAARAGYDGGNIRVMPTGYDAGYWTPADGGTRRGVLCVAAVEDLPRLSIKGIDLMVEAARLVPHAGVTIIGVDERFIPALGAPPNVRFLPRVPREALRDHYRSAKVYCQPSRREGLPAALCEAMLCGCLPVVSGVGGMGEAVGETGAVVPAGDSQSLAAAITGALALPDTAGETPRARIAGLYPLERRRAALLDCIGSL